ncbi:hypothetical protein DPMN_030068 [Dreissena polymorpha]|uniref:Uncharacterized protein n=1 Tax=Dreissena polymorpha TaxID=45954 RepID=A0A9D4LZS5_DREPO|nr:hypothetical protein DPMN_030068 [Dreissena polymorpha]
MITVDFFARKLYCGRLFYAGLEPLRRQYEIDLAVYLPVWSMPAVPGGLCWRSVFAMRVGGFL